MTQQQATIRKFAECLKKAAPATKIKYSKDELVSCELGYFNIDFDSMTDVSTSDSIYLELNACQTYTSLKIKPNQFDAFAEWWEGTSTFNTHWKLYFDWLPNVTNKTMVYAGAIKIQKIIQKIISKSNDLPIDVLAHDDNYLKYCFDGDIFSFDATNVNLLDCIGFNDIRVIFPCICGEIDVDYLVDVVLFPIPIIREVKLANFTSQ
jgi:hypothetical protein